MRFTPPALAAALLLPLLAACGSPARAPAEPEPAGFAECRAEAQRSAEAVNLGRQWMPNNPTQDERLAAERSVVVQRSFEDCLRRRGLTRGGGVEAVRRPGMF
ncbi:phosphoribosylamine--glycine ligase [Falsiroseomonas sp.]|uniref:phosphoribosylamine--glycine ligase n=1 Tax=Falsiroseomonas sp. TaxID=2870721 RepID=UPI0034A3345F